MANRMRIVMVLRTFSTIVLALPLVRKLTSGVVLKPKTTVEAAAATTAMATEFLILMMIVQTPRLEPRLI